MIAVAAHGCAAGVASGAHLIGILSEPVLGDEAAVVGHEEATVFSVAASRAGKLKWDRYWTLREGSNVKKCSRLEPDRLSYQKR